MSHLTKKKILQKKLNNKKRAFNGFNTGERTLKSAKDYNRRDNKILLQKVAY